MASIPSSVSDKMEQVVGAAVDPKVTALLQPWVERRQAGIQDRRRYEPTWHLCQSFLANRQWVGWAEGGSWGSGRIVPLKNPGDRERHTANVITARVMTVLGKFMVDDFQPEVNFRREDLLSEDFAKFAKGALAFTWDEELDGDENMYEGLLTQLAYGIAGMRRYFDPGKGKEIGQLPVGPDGKPITNLGAASEYVQNAPSDNPIDFITVKEGKLCMEALSPFNLVVPPGIAHERNFPWLIVERPQPVEWVKLRYPDSSVKVSPENLTALDTLSMGDAGGMGSKLKGHVMVSTGYEMPTTKFPKGRVVVWTGTTLLDQYDELPYILNGEYHHGVVFFKFNRVPGRFWPIGMVEPMIGPQRQRNRARSQMIELKDRNLGRVYAYRGTISAANKPVGKIMELVEVAPGHQMPQETTGGGIGPWIENEARMNDEDLDRVTGMGEVTMGGTPGSVSAYAALALIAEQDEKRFGPILKSVKKSVADIAKLTLYDIRRYWPESKRIGVAGPDGLVEEHIFKTSELPETYYVTPAKGAAQPRSAAAQTQLTFDLFNSAISAGKPLPPSWIYDSIQAGKPLPIPEDMEEVQKRQAELENALMMQGQMVTPNYYDDDGIHIQEHRQEQMEAQGAGDMNLVQTIEQHIQQHIQDAQNKQTSQGGPGGGVGGPIVPQMQGARGGERPAADPTQAAPPPPGPQGPPMQGPPPQ